MAMPSRRISHAHCCVRSAGASSAYTRAPEASPLSAIRSRYISRFPKSPATRPVIWASVSASRMLCLPANSCTYRFRCLGLILWNVPLWARFSIDQKDSTPFV